MKALSSLTICVSSLIFFTILQNSYCGPVRLQKRAAFYIANETACVVDNTVYSNGDPIPTDDPCEACKCRPPGFACVLKECEVKPGCRAVRRAGHCCPDYVCGCEHNGRMYRDGDEIRDSQNPCYTCHCQGSSIACAFIDCFFRVDCAPEYVPGECCPRYTNCTDPKSSFEGSNPYLKDKEPSIDTTVVPISVIAPGVTYVEETTDPQNDPTTVIEVFEVETKLPETLSLNPEEVRVIDEVTNEESSETHDESTEDSKDEEINPIQPASIDSEILEEPIVPESDIESKVEADVADTLVDAAHSSEETITWHEIFSPEEDLVTTEQDQTKYSTEVSPKPEATLAVENVNVEPEEPNNNLDSASPSSDYGKSLKLDDAKEPISEIDSKEQKTEPKEQKTETDLKEQSQSSQTKQETSTQVVAFTTVKSQAEIVLSTSEKIPIIEENSDSISNSSENISLYVEKDSLKPESAVTVESIETVSTIVEVKDQTPIPSKDTPDFSATPTVADIIFNFHKDKLEGQKFTLLPNITSDNSEKPNATDKSISTDSAVETKDVELKTSSSSNVENSSTVSSQIDDNTTIKSDN